MNNASPYSRVIEQMRRERRAPPSGFDGVSEPGGISSATALAARDPRLEQLGANERFLELMQTDDSTERAAVLEDLKTLVDRCGYHQDSANEQRAMINRRAVRNSRAAHGQARRCGRPRGARNFAGRQFGLGLATIWSELTGCPPSRYEPGRDSARGCYVEFVELVAEAVPAPARRKSSSTEAGTDYLVRTSIMDFRAARNAPEEYRRRGLIDEGLWLHVPASG